MDAAVEGGINFFDVAEMYPVPCKAETCGISEEIVGNWMEARGNREKIILATKVRDLIADKAAYVTPTAAAGPTPL
eukprot:scaffold380476_cov33-Prasinocladus_malaysianus.AAC.1